MGSSSELFVGGLGATSPSSLLLPLLQGVFQNRSGFAQVELQNEPYPGWAIATFTSPALADIACREMDGMEIIADASSIVLRVRPAVNVRDYMRRRVGDDPPARSAYGQARMLKGQRVIVNRATGETLPRASVLEVEGGIYLEKVRTIKACQAGKVKMFVCVERVPHAEDTFIRPVGPDGVSLPRESIVVVKCLKYRSVLELAARNASEDPLREIAVLQHLSTPGHENVTRLQIGPVRDVATHCEHEDTFVASCTACHERRIFVTMPYAGACESPPMELFDFCEAVQRREPRYAHLGGRLGEDGARRLFRQILSGLRYCHEKSVVHLDLTAENVVLTAEPAGVTLGGEGGGIVYADPPGDAVLIDFGMATLVPPMPTLVFPMGPSGKMHYIAPETLRPVAVGLFAADVWALGIILFLLVTGNFPYEVPLRNDANYAAIASGELASIIDAWSAWGAIGGPPISAACVELMQGILKENPFERLTLDQIEAHPWMQGT